MNEPQNVAYLRLQLEDALPFIRDRLRDGKTLSHLLLDGVDFSQGVVISTLPEEVGTEVASKDIQSGGKLPSPRPPVRGYHMMPDGRRMPIDGYFAYPDGRREYLDKYWAPIQSIISDFLGRTRGGLCIFESQIRSATDPLHNAIGRLAFFRSEVLTILDEESVEAPEWMSMVISQNSGAWLEISILTSLPEESRLPPHRGQIKEEQLREFAAGAEAVMIGAYDGEGHVVWTRNNGDRWLGF